MSKITITEVNNNFLIRLYSIGCIDRLVGAGTLKTYIGSEKANKSFSKAFDSGMNETTVKYRRGLRIVFVRK